jgi:hypothetical protein
MSGGTKPPRRELHFGSLDEIAAEVDRLVAGSVSTVGNWTFAQILAHLAAGMHAAIDGFPFRAPWWARTFVAPWMKNSFLTRPMPAGFKLPQRAVALMPPPEMRLEKALADFRHGLNRLASEPKRAPHPFVGKLTREEWNLLTQRHCELHLSFVLPEPG